MIEADLSDRAQATAAIQQAVDRFSRLDIVKQCRPMYIGIVAGADVGEWELVAVERARKDTSR